MVVAGMQLTTEEAQGVESAEEWNKWNLMAVPRRL
jgi:hypothetical protein